jgi:hypothetical protein
MSKKTPSHTTLAYSEENCAHKEFPLDKLPAIHDNIKQLAIAWRNIFKYFQVNSHGYNKWKIEGNREKMTEVTIAHGGTCNAC